jgi:hypothetical protein
MTTATDEPITAPAPEPSDAKARVADDKPLTTDPDAPFGYMRDPKTGETRPRKRPGRQKVKADPKPPPAAHKPRTDKLPATPAEPEDYGKRAAEFLQGLWMLMPPVAGLPMIPEALSVRVKAQAAILDANLGNLAHSMKIAADNNETVATFLVRMTSGGASWILPAMGGLIPFIAMTGTMWAAPVAGDVSNLAAMTDYKWQAIVESLMKQAQAFADEMNTETPADGDGTPGN